MKPKGRHPHKRLTATAVRNFGTGSYADGNGLYLVVSPTGSRKWVFRTTINGRRHNFGLGSAQIVTLAEAREQALEFHRVVRRGGDPAEERKKARRKIPTFGEAAETVHAARRGGWKNSKHAAQWVNTLRTYAHPIIGGMGVDQIEPGDVLKVLGPIWIEKPETARRVRQRIAAVMDWAMTAGHRSSINPCHGVEKGLPRQTDTPKHHAAIPYGQVPDFVHQLRNTKANPITKLAFEFLILTAGRTSEILLATPDEFDIDNALWTMPAVRMKMGHEHRVPLSTRAIAILHQANDFNHGSPYIFPGRAGRRPLSNMAFKMLMRRIGIGGTPHGFRSSFKDWAIERTAFPDVTSECALAHARKSKVERAYARSDLLDQRRLLMAEWAEFIESGNATVVRLRMLEKAGK